MPENEVEIHESNSEHKQPADNDVLPTTEPQTPLQTPHYQPFPYFAYSPYSMPSTTPLAMPGNATHHLPTIYPHPLITNCSHLATPATPINHEASVRSTSTWTYLKLPQPSTLTFPFRETLSHRHQINKQTFPTVQPPSSTTTRTFPHSSFILLTNFVGQEAFKHHIKFFF
jgi:hypothetical protein